MSKGLAAFMWRPGGASEGPWGLSQAMEGSPGMLKLVFLLLTVYPIINIGS